MRPMFDADTSVIRPATCAFEYLGACNAPLLEFAHERSNNGPMKTAFESLKDHFLIAMPSLTEGIFAHSLTYLCEHNEHGAMGIIINRPMGVALG